LATEIKENYKIGDRVTIEGRLEMTTMERDGYKEKRAKLVASRIYHIMVVGTPTTPTGTTSVAPSSPPASSRATAPAAPRAEEPPAFDTDDLDKIPF